MNRLELIKIDHELWKLNRETINYLMRPMPKPSKTPFDWIAHYRRIKSVISKTEA